MSDWRIWEAQRGEAAVLVDLEARSCGVRSWGRDSVEASFVASGVTVLFGGADENQPQGFALWRDLGEEAEILTIGVVPEARGAGLGAALLERVLASVRAGGAYRLFLEVAADNQGARALYTCRGFRKIGARKRYYRDGGDAVVMAADL